MAYFNPKNEINFDSDGSGAGAEREEDFHHKDDDLTAEPLCCTGIETDSRIGKGLLDHPRTKVPAGWSVVKIGPRTRSIKSPAGLTLMITYPKRSGEDFPVTCWNDDKTNHE